MTHWTSMRTFRMFTRISKSAMKPWRSLKNNLPSSKGRVVLGIDPGLARMGYGVVVQEGGRMTAGEYGTLTTEAHTALEKRLVVLFEKLGRVLKKVKPEVVAMEELFFTRNVKTGIAVGQARGVALLACGLAGVPVYEYRPMEIKQAVAGHGNADK